MPSLDMPGLDPLFRTGFGYLALMALASARLSIIVLVLPVFNRTGVTGIRRVCVALVLSLPIAWHLLGGLDQVMATGVGPLTLLIVKESFIGLLLGFGFGIPFWAAAAAGDVLDLQRGSQMAYLIDPSQISEASISGTFLQLVMVALFYVGGGPHLLLTALYDSYGLWPPLAPMPSFAPDGAALLLAMLDRIMMLAFLLGAPLFIVLFMVEATMALVARMSPQLHIFDLSLPVKGIALFTVLPVYITFYIHHADTLLGDEHGVLATLAQLLR
ncbi:MAG TPA: type III secretion system export apparatus subunit SctT [Actinocrinis sp.]|nr:type III secretion system export apparatus subunit SctT [Actinocrinis sp.]